MTVGVLGEWAERTLVPREMLHGGRPGGQMRGDVRWTRKGKDMRRLSSLKISVRVFVYVDRRVDVMAVGFDKSLSLVLSPTQHVHDAKQIHSAHDKIYRTLVIVVWISWKTKRPFGVLVVQRLWYIPSTSSRTRVSQGFHRHWANCNQTV